MQIEAEEIGEAVKRFRACLELCHSRMGIPFRDFPEGCCGSASELLAAFLKDAGFGTFALVSGWDEGENATSHAWLEGNGFIIDITIDQFPEGSSHQMVSDNFDFHAQFNRKKQRQADGDFRTMGTPKALKVSYGIILRCLHDQK